MAGQTHKGWHSRGYLPHLDAREELQSLTFRLGDALPKKVVDGWKEELRISACDDAKSAEELRRRIAKYEDAGHGECLLGDARCAKVVQDTLLHFDGDRYRVLEWCVMPNHVHVLVKLLGDTRQGDLVKSWKTFSSMEMNKVIGRKGSRWAPDYHDRYIRDEEHLMDARCYIRRNPVAAGLCMVPEDWEWGSAWRGGG